MVPSLVVINNKTGRVLTSGGMEAIEASAAHADGSKHLLEQWRKGHSGVQFCAKISNFCTIL